MAPCLRASHGRMTSQLVSALRNALGIIEYLGKLHRTGDPLALQERFDYVNARSLPYLHELLVNAEARVEAAGRAGVCPDCCLSPQRSPPE